MKDLAAMYGGSRKALKEKKALKKHWKKRLKSQYKNKARPPNAPEPKVKLPPRPTGDGPVVRIRNFPVKPSLPLAAINPRMDKVKKPRSARSRFQISKEVPEVGRVVEILRKKTDDNDTKAAADPAEDAAPKGDEGTEDVWEKAEVAAVENIGGTQMYWLDVMFPDGRIEQTTFPGVDIRLGDKDEKLIKQLPPPEEKDDEQGAKKPTIDPFAIASALHAASSPKASDEKEEPDASVDTWSKELKEAVNIATTMDWGSNNPDADDDDAEGTVPADLGLDEDADESEIIKKLVEQKLSALGLASRGPGVDNDESEGEAGAEDVGEEEGAAANEEVQSDVQSDVDEEEMQQKVIVEDLDPDAIDNLAAQVLSSFGTGMESGNPFIDDANEDDA